MREILLKRLKELADSYDNFSSPEFGGFMIGHFKLSENPPFNGMPDDLLLSCYEEIICIVKEIELPLLEDVTHTKGPWKFDQHEGCKFIKGGKMGNGRQAQYTKLAFTSGLFNEERDYANAKLMAASPLLLNGCFLAIKHLLNNSPERGYAEIIIRKAIRSAGYKNKI